VINSDQSAFNFEVRAGRTLALKGDADVQCLVKSVSNLTHSYTIMPMLTLSGKLVSPLFLLTKEVGGKFPAKGYKKVEKMYLKQIFSQFLVFKYLCMCR
jgi:hypothetical protein